MKKWQTKMIDVNQQTDLENELNTFGQAGWRFAHALATPYGVKFMLERQLDEEVSLEDLKKSQEEIHKAELAKKFGV